MKFCQLKSSLLYLWIVATPLLVFPILVHAQEREPRHIKIGVTLPLTGSLAHVGQDIRRGMELAISDLATIPISIDVIFEDNAHDLKQAASTAQKLLSQDKVDVIISLWDMADVVAPLAERRHVAHLAIRWDPEIAHTHSYTLTMESTYQSYVQSQVQLVLSLQKTRIGILTEEAQGWILGSEYLQRIAGESNISIVGEERVTHDGRDFRSSILRLLQKQPELIILYSNPPVTDLLIRQLRELAPKQAFTGYFEVLSDPTLVEGIPFVSQFQVSPWFEEEFQSRYAERFVARAPQAYDLINLIALAEASSAKKLIGKDLIAALISQASVPGAAGMLHVRSERNIENECAWKIARGGKFESLRLADLLGYR